LELLSLVFELAYQIQVADGGQRTADGDEH
jgi:hypothetical protein